VDGCGILHQLVSIKHCVVGGIPTLLKNMKVNGKDYPTYYGKYKMFKTTNQLYIVPHPERKGIFPLL
jgi:hypothetical protein